MKKRILTWITTLVVTFTMVMGGSVSAFAARVEGVLDWSWSVPMAEDDYGFGFGITSPATHGVYIYVVSYDKLYKIHYTTGEVVATTALGGNVMYSKNAPTITAKKKIVIPLADSKLAIVDRDTMELEKVITYADGETGYQSNVQAVYDSAENAVYLGSWGGSKYGTYVQVDLDVSDNYRVTEIVSGKGFYYAGAAVNGNHVVFGSEAVGGDTDGNAMLYAWNKVTGKTISAELVGSGAIRSTVVAYNDGYYFTARGGGFYKAVIDDTTDPLNPKITVTLIADLGDGSICTPLIIDGVAYVGYQKSAKGGVKSVDLSSNPAKVTEVATDIPAIVSDLHQCTIGQGKGNIYATYNGTPGGIWDVTNNTHYFEPDAKMQQYCMSTIVQPTSVKKMYYTNDGGYLISVKEASSGTTTTHKVTISAGEGGTVSPAVTNVSDGGTAKIYIAPDAGNKVASIKVNGIEQNIESSTFNPYSIKNVKADTNVEVAFRKAETYKVTASAGAGGTVSPVSVNIQEGETAKILITPDEGNKVVSVKVNGEEQKLKSSMITSFEVKNIKENTRIEVAFAKIVFTNEEIEVSVQKGDTFYVAHEKLMVNSGLAESKGYTDNVDIETTSALDALVAAHVHVYGDDADVKQYLTVSGGMITKMMGVVTDYYPGYVVNEMEDSASAISGVTQMPLKAGDRVDYFYYEEAYTYADTITILANDTGNKITGPVTIKENEKFNVKLTGKTMMAWPAFEGSLTGASIVTLEKQADGSYKVKEQLKDKDGNAVSTNSEGKATLDLAPGKYYLSAVKGNYSSKLVMPWLELTVLCDEHTFKDGACTVCEHEMVEGEDYKLVKSGVKAVTPLTRSDVIDKMRSGIKAADGKIKDENIDVFNLDLLISEDNGKTWEDTELDEKFPTEGLEIVMEYPAGTNGESCEFKVNHMFDSGKKVTEIENLTVEETKDGLKTNVTSLSPFAIGWTVTDPDAAPKTGDDFNAVIFGIAALVAITAALIVVRKRRA